MRDAILCSSFRANIPGKAMDPSNLIPIFPKDAILSAVLPKTLFSSLRISLLILCIGVALPIDLSGASPRRSIPQASAEFEALPLTRSRQNHLLVHAFINDKPALLIVDSGSPGTVIASKRRAHFGLSEVPLESKYPSRVQVNGSYNSLVIAHALRLGELNVADVPAISVDLSGPRHAALILHEPVADGILGVDVLFATRAVLDCQRQLLILNMKPEMKGRVPGLNLSGFEQVPMSVSEGFNLYVDGSVNGAPARLMVDTGAFTTLLHRPFVKGLHIPTRRTPLQSAAINIKGERLDLARIRRLSFGLFNITSKDVGVVNLDGILHESSPGTPAAVGLLGAEILKSHHGIIDFGTCTLYLKN